jgi:hypothetical protein
MLTCRYVRVTLRPPPDWHSIDDATCVTPAPPATPQVVVQIGALVVCPEDLAAWKLASSRVHAHGPVVAVAEAETPFVTQTGWPAVRTRLSFAREAGEVVEYRVVVYYQFLHTVAAVLARSLSAAALDSRQEELRQLFVSAQPDFGDGEPVALIDFWN